MAGPLVPLLQVQDLDVALGGRRILQAVTLNVPQGCWFGLLGVNGSGKTTLLRALSGRLKPGQGTIRLAGEDLTSHAADRARRIGFAPPPDSLPPEVSGGELLDLIAAARRAPARLPADIYEALGVGPLERVMIGQMSSGMRQRIAVFSAFIGAPEILLLDEPFNWLDPLAAYDLKVALQAWTAGGQTVITALHDIATFAIRCNLGLLLHEGRVIRRFEAVEMAKGRADVAGFEEDIYATFRQDRDAAA